MRRILFAAVAAIAVAGCQSSGSRAPVGPRPVALTVPPGGQSVTINSDPQTVRASLVSSASERGTKVVQNDANMVVMERTMNGPNAALDQEFGPSDNGDRVIRVRVRFQGAGCQTQAVQDLAIINNARTALEQSYALPGNPNTMESLQGLKQKAESLGCRPA